MTPRRPTPAPKDLGDAGRTLWRKADREYVFSCVEFELLHQLCVTLDEIAGMKADLSEMGYIVAGAEKQPRPNPLIATLREHRKLADQLVTALALPIEGEAVGRRRSAQAKQAADARWRKPKSGSRIHAVRRMQGGGAA